MKAVGKMKMTRALNQEQLVLVVDSCRIQLLLIQRPWITLTWMNESLRRHLQIACPVLTTVQSSTNMSLPSYKTKTSSKSSRSRSFSPKKGFVRFIDYQRCLRINLSGTTEPVAGMILLLFLNIHVAACTWSFNYQALIQMIRSHLDVKSL